LEKQLFHGYQIWAHVSWMCMTYCWRHIECVLYVRRSIRIHCTSEREPSWRCTEGRSFNTARKRMWESQPARWVWLIIGVTKAYWAAAC